ncbi:U6 snRNA-associated Sm-like protein LSm2 [Acrasis kona]|uniref:U6 snRNA-associated Sm-like protein LSm2 n=1 Tax=Acrasis kona TaxID=1008807 RepID=A0AAW2Z2I5_9EUKA
MLFFSFFKTLVDKEVIVELKNEVSLKGTLHSVDQYLNIKLNNVEIVDEQKYPYLGCLKNCFIRGSTVRYIQLPAADVDTDVLQDATRKEHQVNKK